MKEKTLYKWILAAYPIQPIRLGQHDSIWDFMMESKSKNELLRCL